MTHTAALQYVSTGSSTACVDKVRERREFDLNSAVCSARVVEKDGSRLLHVEGYAFGSQGPLPLARMNDVRLIRSMWKGTPIKRVEVSYDGSREEWHEAELERQAPTDGKDWGWTLWRFEAQTIKGKDITVTARAGSFRSLCSDWMWVLKRGSGGSGCRRKTTT